jgi:hypothetical protein
MLELGRNVFLDGASGYEWAELNESVFLERVFAELEHLMGEAFFDYAFFILSSHDSEVRPASLAHPAPRKVLVFITDESGSVPRDLGPHYQAVFKGYLPGEMPGTNIFPFSIGYAGDVPAFPVRPLRERGIQVFFSGTLTVNRLPLYRALHPVYRRLPAGVAEKALSLSTRGFGEALLRRDLSQSVPGALLRFTRGFKDGFTPAQFGSTLADSRIALCPRGARNPETFRHMEAMRAGAVVVSERLPPTRFYRDAPIVTVDDWDTGIAQARALLGDLPRLEELQRETVGWWDTVCSERATASYMQEALAASRPT